MGVFLKKIRTRTCSNRCDTTLGPETAVNTLETPYAELEILHEIHLVSKISIGKVLTNTDEKEK